MYQKLLIFAAKKHLFWGSYSKPTPPWAKEFQKMILYVCAIYGTMLTSYPSMIPAPIQAAILHYGVLCVPLLVLFFGYFKMTMPETLAGLLNGSQLKSVEVTQSAPPAKGLDMTITTHKEPDGPPVPQSYIEPIDTTKQPCTGD